MRRIAAFGLLVAGLVVSACGADTTNPTNPSPTPTDPGPGAISSVHPTEAFLGRSTEIIIAGDETMFDANSTVSFGDGVTVSEVEVMGPGTLRVMASIDAFAAAGPRDLTVSTAEGDASMSGALNLRNPIEVELYDGTEQAGSITFYTIRNLDLDNPFTQDLSFEVSEDTGTEVVGGGVMSDEEAMLIVYFDLYGEPKPVSVTTLHDGLTSYAADAFTGTATQVATIDPAVGFNPTLDAAGKIAAGRLDMLAGEVVTLDMTAAGDAPVIMLFDTTHGTFFDNKMFAVADKPITLGAEVDGSYVIVLHDSQLLVGGGPTDEVVTTVTSETIGMVSEVEPNDDHQNPQMLTQFPDPALLVMDVNTPGDLDVLAGDLTTYGVPATYVRAISMPSIENGLTMNDTYFRAYEDDTLVLVNEDDNAYFAGLSTFLVGSTAYLEVLSSPQYAPDDVGRHLVAVWAEAATLTTDAEPNADTATASPLTTAPAVSLANIEAAGDQDYFSFTLAADSHVILETGPSGDTTLPASDTMLELYDDQGNLVAENEDKGFFDYFSKIEMDLAAGTYYVMAASSATYAPDDTGDYRLMFIVE